MITCDVILRAYFNCFTPSAFHIFSQRASGFCCFLLYIALFKGFFSSDFLVPWVAVLSIHICLLQSLGHILSQRRKKHLIRPGLQTMIPRRPCEYSDHFVFVPHGRSVTIFLLLNIFVPESAWNNAGSQLDSSFAARKPSPDQHWTTNCHRGRIIT